MLALLLVIGIVFFLATRYAVASYRAKESRLAKQWEAKGHAFLQASQPSGAVEAFQNALRYDPTSQQLRYAMVDSLLTAGRSEQARSYLLNMWEHQPANGLVNLQLGRIAASRKDIRDATQYYHNAIYGVWDSSPQQNRLQARLELAHFLLGENGKREADAELLALVANSPPTADLAYTVGELFLQADDAANAERQFQSALQSSPREPKLLAAAGRAAFALKKYATAESYLEQAKSRGNTDAEITRLLDLTDLILKNDPLDRRVSFGARVQRTIQAMATATNRLEACASQTDKAGGTPPELEQMLQQLDSAQDKKKLQALRHDPDLLIGSAKVAFAAEEAAAESCGQPQGLDLALLLIGRSHSEGEQ